MAVVQISKIQVRRGQKNSNSGIPQLSSAEFAWAVDSQELFIGNGSVAEGAPYVGNTKILTEHDNILELASSYHFASNNAAITLSVPRSLQSKLDEYVSVTDFGAVGDGVTDCVEAFETAFQQLFQNVDPTLKKYLLIPNGEYYFASDLTIPSEAILKGETQLGTVLNIDAHNIRFVTSTGLELVDFNSTNRPKNINISQLTIKRTTGQFTLSGIADSVFQNITFLGEYVLGDSLESLIAEPSALFWENDLIGVRTTNVKFIDCSFNSNSISIKCIQTDVFDTEIDFDNCNFFVNDTAIYVDGISTQGTKWKIYDSNFEEIYNNAFRSTYGHGTIINRCFFKNVGNGINNSSDPIGPMVYFGESANNIVIDSTSDRQQDAGIVSVGTSAAYTEVYNGSLTTFVDRNYSQIYLSDSFRPLAVFSALNKFTSINYSLKLGEHTRYGNITFVIGDDLSPGTNGSDISITDNFTYSPNFVLSEGGNLMTNFEFNVTKTSNTTGDDSTAAVVDTIVLSYKNPLASGKTGSISFDVTYGV